MPADLRIDPQYLQAQLMELAALPTDVPAGDQTLMEPDEPKLRHYVQDVVKPRLASLGIELIDAPRNNLLAVLRGGPGPCLLIQTYTVSQHHQEMAEPYRVRVESAARLGFDEPAVFARGVSQNKVHQAVMLTVLNAFAEAKPRLTGSVYWSLNNEGRSSHACTAAILSVLPAPDFAIVLQPTGLRIQLGNRGRVDVLVTVKGKATHSSTPDQGLSAIEGANEVLNRLKRLCWSDAHPLLGRRQAIAYQVRYFPLAPHTLPSHAYLTIDRRLLPGDDPARAVDEIRDAIGDLSPYEVAVTQGVTMLPSLTPRDSPWVAALIDAHGAVTKQVPECSYGAGTFDAGGTASVGVPTVTYGAGIRSSLIGDDFVTMSSAVVEAETLSKLISDQLISR